MVNQSPLRLVSERIVDLFVKVIVVRVQIVGCEVHRVIEEEQS